MRHILFLIILTGSSFSSFAQVKFNRTYTKNNSVVTIANVVISTNDGGYLLAGSRGGPHFFSYFVKTDYKGDTIWTYLGDTNIVFNYRGLVQCKDGGYVAVGQGEGLSGSTDVILTKISVNGQFQWKRYFGNNHMDIGTGIIEIQDGFILSGFGKSFTNGLKNEAYIIKTDSLGNQQWFKHYGGIQSDELAYGIVKASDDGYVLAGHMLSFGKNYIFLLKTNSQGDSLWQTTIKDSVEFGTYGLQLDKANDGGYIVCGIVTDTIGTNYSSTLYFNSKGYVVKTDDLGKEEWHKKYVRRGGYDWLKNIKALPDNNGYVAVGYKHNRESIGDSTYKGWLIRIAQNGDSLWSRYYSDGVDIENEIENVIITKDKGFAFCGTGIGKAWFVKTDSLGCDSVSCVPVIGIKEFENSIFESLKVWPNPIENGELRIESEGLITGVDIYNAIGEKVKQMVVNTKHVVIDVSGLRKSIYLVYLKTNEGNAIQKIIIQ